MSAHNKPAAPAGGVSKRFVKADEDGMRLDRWFRQHYPALKHGRLEKLLRTGQIRVDGGRVKANARLEKGQEVRIPPASALMRAQGERDQELPLAKKRVKTDDVAARAQISDMTLYEDEAVLILNKPPGMAVQGGTRTERHLDHLLQALPGEPGRLTHRLDKDTSGVLVVAKTAPAARALSAAFRERITRKFYWAITVGVPSAEEGDIDAPLAKGGPKDGSNKGAERVRLDEEEGKRALTRFVTIDRAAKQAAWLGLLPVTGRTHQLRAHLVLVGAPIMGDGKYGGAEARLDGFSRGLHLHARRLVMPHPVKGLIDATAPPPPHFTESLAALGFALGEGDAALEKLIDADSLA